MVIVINFKNHHCSGVLNFEGQEYISEPLILEITPKKDKDKGDKGKKGKNNKDE